MFSVSLFLTLAFSLFAQTLALPANFSLSGHGMEMWSHPPTYHGVDWSSSMPRGGTLGKQAVLLGPNRDPKATFATPGPTLSQSSNGTVPGSKKGGPIAFSNSPFPATLLLCQNPDCGSCLGFDLGSATHNQCLVPTTPGFAFKSVAISQPSNVGVGFVVGVGQGDCANFVDISLVNTCFDITQDAQFTQFALNDV